MKIQYITGLLLFLFVLQDYRSTAQATEQDTVVISPLQVDLYYPAQKEYYLAKYASRLSNIKEGIENFESQIRKFEEKGRLNKKEKKARIEVQEKIEKLRARHRALDSAIQTWKTFESDYHDSYVNMNFDSARCYELIANNGTYPPNAYAQVVIDPDERIFWHEHLVPMVTPADVETIKVKEKSTRWVKKRADRNCLSANPEDCLVWCIVEEPAQFRTITTPAKYHCPATFSFVPDKERCLRKMELENSLEYIKFIDLKTQSEIRVIDLVEVDCEAN